MDSENDLENKLNILICQEGIFLSWLYNLSKNMDTGELGHEGQSLLGSRLRLYGFFYLKGESNTMISLVQYRKSAAGIFLVVFIAGVFLLAGCSNTGQNQNGKNTYTIADGKGDWGYPTPYSHYIRGPGYIRMSLIFDTLVWKDEEGLVRSLSESWEYSEGDNSYTFDLREGVKWHDGQEFNADDVVFTFNYMKEHPYPWVDLSKVEEVEKNGEYEVTVFLNEPFAPFIVNVAGTMPILPEHIYKDIEDPEDFTGPEAVVGTGPFKFADYNKEHGTYLYEANEEYYLGKPEVDEIRFIKTGEQVVSSAVKEGTVNVGSVPSEAVSEFKNTEFQVISTENSSITKLMFNHQVKPFNDKNFRQLLAHAIDREELVEVAQRGYAVKGSPGFLPPDSEWHSSDIKNYPYDPGKSREMLENLGYSYEDGICYNDGEPLEIEILTKSDTSRTAELIKSDLEEIGITTEIRSYDDKTVDSKVTNWDFDMALNSHGGLGGDPQNLNKFILADDFNSARYKENEELVELLNKQIAEMDTEKRRDLIADIQNIYSEDLPTLSLYYPSSYWIHDGTRDIYFTPGGIAIGVPIPLNKLSFVE